MNFTDPDLLIKLLDRANHVYRQGEVNSFTSRQNAIYNSISVHLLDNRLYSLLPRTLNDFIPPPDDMSTYHTSTTGAPISSTTGTPASPGYWSERLSPSVQDQLQNAVQAVEETPPSAPTPPDNALSTDQAQRDAILDRIAAATYTPSPAGVRTLIEDLTLLNNELHIACAPSTKETYVLCRPNHLPVPCLTLLTAVCPPNIPEHEWLEGLSLHSACSKAAVKVCLAGTKLGIYRLRAEDLTKTARIPASRFYTNLDKTTDQVPNPNSLLVQNDQVAQCMGLSPKLMKAINNVCAKLFVKPVDACTPPQPLTSPASQSPVDALTAPVEYRISMRIDGVKIKFTKVPITTPEVTNTSSNSEVLELANQLRSVYVKSLNLWSATSNRLRRIMYILNDYQLGNSEEIARQYTSTSQWHDSISRAKTILDRDYRALSTPPPPPDEPQVFAEYIPNSEAQFLTPDRVRSILSRSRLVGFSGDGYVRICPTPATLQPSEDLFKELREYLNSFGVEVQVKNVFRAAALTRGAFRDAEYRLLNDDQLHIYRKPDYTIEFSNKPVTGDGYTPISSETSAAIMYVGPCIAVQFVAYCYKITAYCVRRGEFIEAVTKTCTNKAAMKGIRDLPDTEFIYLANSQWCERNTSGGVQAEGVDYHSPLVSQKTLREWVLNSMGVRLALEGNATAAKYVTIGASTEAKSKAIDDYFKSLETLNETLKNAGPSDYEVVLRATKPDSTPTPAAPPTPVSLPTPVVPEPQTQTNEVPVAFGLVEQELLAAFGVEENYVDSEEDTDNDDYDPFGDD